MRVRGTQQATVQPAGDLHVVPVPRPARHLVHAVVADWPGPDDGEACGSRFTGERQERPREELDCAAQRALPASILRRPAANRAAAGLAVHLDGAGVPVLGLCLGAQLLAAALGGETGRMAAPEVGWKDISLTPQGREDALFAGQPWKGPQFCWHSDHV